MSLATITYGNIDVRPGFDTDLFGLGDLNVANVVRMDSTADGSIVTAGGLEVAKGIQAGGDVVVDGQFTTRSSAAFDAGITASGQIVALSTADAAVVVAGGVEIAKGASIAGNLAVTQNTEISGALDVQGPGTFANTVAVSATTVSTSASSGALVVAGGVGIQQNVFVGQNLSVAGTSTFAGNFVTNTTDSMNASTGALIVAGGLGVAKRVNIGTDLSVAGSATFTSFLLVQLPRKHAILPAHGLKRRFVDLAPFDRFGDVREPFALEHIQGVRHGVGVWALLSDDDALVGGRSIVRPEGFLHQGQQFTLPVPPAPVPKEDQLIPCFTRQARCQIPQD
ncbi:hypothetical protein HK102_001851, partial [Quaeritorhiza haematococci]